MSKAHKRITLVLSITLIITLLGGCGVINIYDEKKLQENAIKYMEKKYGEEFIINNCGERDTTYDFRMIAKDHEDWKYVYVKWNFKEKEFSDNYMSWYFRDKLSQQFQSICREIYPNCIVINIPFGAQASRQYSTNTTLEEYLDTEDTSNYDLFVVDDPKQKEDKVRQLSAILNKKNQDVYLRVVYVTQDTLESIDNNTYEEIFADEKYTWSGLGYIKREETPSAFHWREVS